MPIFGFANRDDIAREFEEGAGETWKEDGAYVPAADFPTEEQILLAHYETGSYEGSAYVLFRGKDGNLYEVEGGHCSCNGLEGQWIPGLVTPESLALRLKTHDDGGYMSSPLSDPEVWAEYERIVRSLLEGRA